MPAILRRPTTTLVLGKITSLVASYRGKDLTWLGISVERQLLGPPESHLTIISSNVLTGSSPGFILGPPGSPWYRIGDRFVLLAEPDSALQGTYAPRFVRFVDEEGRTRVQAGVDLKPALSRRERWPGRPLESFYDFIARRFEPDGESIQSTLDTLLAWHKQGILKASSACPELLDRLPGAYAAYVRGLESQGRGKELTRSPEESMDSCTGTNDSTWVEVTETAGWPNERGLPPFPSSDRLLARLVADTTRWGDEYTPCRERLDRAFEHSAGTIRFTMGNATEACLDDPAMIWTSGEEQHRGPFPDFNCLNVSQLWCTGSHLIFGLSNHWEFGREEAGLAFWDLTSGNLVTLYALTRSGADSESKVALPDPQSGLGVYLRDLEDAEVISVQGGIVLRTLRSSLVFWPEEKRWAHLTKGP